MKFDEGGLFVDTSKPGIKHTYRKTTPEERVRHARIREDVKAHLPEMRAEAQEALENAMKTGLSPRPAILTLKRERKRQGLSFADMKARSGIDRASACRLENSPDANPTINTLERYAKALGKKLLIVLADE
jgi:DNA-binding phage protein